MGPFAAQGVAAADDEIGVSVAAGWSADLTNSSVAGAGGVKTLPAGGTEVPAGAMEAVPQIGPRIQQHVMRASECL